MFFPGLVQSKAKNNIDYRSASIINKRQPRLAASNAKSARFCNRSILVHLKRFELIQLLELLFQNTYLLPSLDLQYVETTSPLYQQLL